ncbi:unnamed protein product, partial [Scytosiphon promiscuus]
LRRAEAGEAGSGVCGRGAGRAWNAAKSDRPPEVLDKHGLIRLPRDNLSTVAEEVMSVGDTRTHLIEEARLRPSYVPPLLPVQQPSSMQRNSPGAKDDMDVASGPDDDDDAAADRGRREAE